MIPGTTSQPTLAGTWRSVVIHTVSAVSPSATSPLTGMSCSSFQWVGATHSATEVSGDFTAVCNGSIQVTGTGVGRLANSTAATVSVTGAGTLPGVGGCPFTISAQGPLDGDTLRLQYTGTSCAGPFSGQETLRRSDIYPDPPAPQVPAPPPPPPPPPSQGGGGGQTGDQLDLHSVSIVLGADLTNWAVTSTMINAYRSGSDLCTDHTKAGQWPRLSWFGDPNVPVEGNQWMFALINGRWYGGAGEWMRPGQVCKNIDGHVGAGAYGGTIMEHWTPSPGELIGLAVSTPARAGQWGTAERSNVVLMRW
ncbi:MAG: hypothetical protein ABI051_17110 [Vicinamibacterales bacterium]